MSERNWITEEIENWIINDEGMNRHAESICRDNLKAEDAAVQLEVDFSDLEEKIRKDRPKDAAGEDIDWEDVCHVVRNFDDDGDYLESLFPEEHKEWWHLFCVHPKLLENSEIFSFHDWLEYTGDI